MKKGDIIQIQIVDMTEDGKGIGRFDSLVFFISGAVPGDVIEAQITKLKKRYGIAKLLKVLKFSDSRVNPKCKYFGNCGGCSLLNLNYERQLELKRNAVIDKLTRIGKIPNPTVRDIVPSELIKGYRNKARYAIGSDGSVGFYVRGSNRVIDCKTCRLQNDAAIKIAECIRQLIKDGIIPCEADKNGSLRAFTVKTCKGSGEVMVVMEVLGKELLNEEEIVYAIEDSLDNVEGYFLKSVAIATLKNKDIHSEIDKYKVIAGTETITDSVEFSGGKTLKFEIAAPSFYQINTKQMVNLYEKAREYAKLTGEELLLDLYCGIGTIGLSMADEAKYVMGIESVKEAILNANRNASINGIVNAVYYRGKVEEILASSLNDLEERINKEIGLAKKVAIVDPPRAGCDENLLKTLVESDPERIVYISCDAGTLARDVKYLETNGYKFVEATPIDMFPNTMAIETVALLCKA